jgi:hypothetical protein
MSEDLGSGPPNLGKRSDVPVGNAIGSLASPPISQTLVEVFPMIPKSPIVERVVVMNSSKNSENNSEMLVRRLSWP